jgi:hypothetical protein
MTQITVEAELPLWKHIKTVDRTMTIGNLIDELRAKYGALRGLFYEGRLQPRNKTFDAFVSLSPGNLKFRAYQPSEGPGLEQIWFWTDDEIEKANSEANQLVVAEIDSDTLDRIVSIAPVGLMNDRALLAMWYKKPGEDIEKMQRYIRRMTSNLCPSK